MPETDPVHAARSSTMGLWSGIVSVGSGDVDARAVTLWFRRAQRLDRGGGWVVGWVLVDVHTKMHLGGVGDRRHADGDVPYLCAAPATGWRGRVLSCRARLDGTWAPLQSFQFRCSASLLSHLSRDGVVPARSGRKQDRGSDPFSIRAPPHPDARCTHPTAHLASDGRTLSVGRAAGGCLRGIARLRAHLRRRRGSPRPPRRGLSQLALWRSVIFVVGLMMSVQRHR